MGNICSVYIFTVQAGSVFNVGFVPFGLRAYILVTNIIKLFALGVSL